MFRLEAPLIRQKPVVTVGRLSGAWRRVLTCLSGVFAADTLLGQKKDQAKINTGKRVL
jgi:hypothetical protein